MHGSSVFLLSFFTSAATAVGAVYFIQRYDIFQTKTPVVDTVVPELRGLAEADARANATVAHLALLVASREPNADARGGTVLRQSVPAGQHVARDYSMNIVLAEEIPKVPTVADLPVADAKTKLEQAGYSMQVSATVASPTVPEGVVIEQTPAAGAAQPKGTTIAVQVSSGTGDVEVPKLIGLSITTAKANLEKLGLKAVVHWISVGETPTYVVLNQKPAAGEKLKPDAEVQLTACQ